MFVYSLRTKLSRRKIVIILLSFLLICCVTVVWFVALNLEGATAVSEKTGEYSTAVTADKVNDFASQFSLEIERLYSEQYIYIPYEFNDTYSGYNELQKRQGLDLLKYRGKKCTLSVYKLKDYKIDYKDAYLSIIVYKGKVIGGHISTLVMNSSLYTFCGD